MKADPAQTHVARTFKHSSPFISCRFDPQGRYVFGTAEDMTIQRWELESGKKTSIAGPHDSWIGALAFGKDGQTLISGGFDGRLVWWPVSAEKPEPIRTVDAHDGWVRALAASPDGTLLASGGNDRKVKLWNLDDGTLLKELPGHEGHVYSTLFHPSGRFVLSGDLKGQVKQWDVQSGKEVRSFDAKELHTYNKGQGVDYGGVRSLAFTPDGKRLASSGLHKATNPLGAVNEPLVLVFDWESGEKKQSHLASGVRGIGWRIVYHPQGFLIGGSGGGGGGFLLFWKPDADKPFHKLKMPNTTRDLDLHADGIQLAAAHHNSTITISRMAPKDT